MEDTNSSIYALKTSAGQERNVARLLARKARTVNGVGISAILVPESLKGYILVESSTKIDLRNPEMKVQHLRGVVEGKVGITFEEAKRFLKPEPIISSIQKGSIVELISGPFKGERAKVVRIDESREEVVLELIEAAVPIPVTVKADQIRIIHKDTVEVLIEGGSATPGPPLGPALGPFGINMMQVVEEINKKSADFAGMKVPVKVTIDRDTKDFEIEIGTPPTTSLIMEELGIEKASHEPGLDIINDLPIETALKIARMKFDSLLANDYKAGVKEVMGTCVSMGLSVDGKDPREAQKDVDAGKYDDILVE